MALPSTTASGRGSRAVLASSTVPISMVAVAGAGYLLLAAAGRTLPAAGFVSLSAFYLLANTVGRGTFAALELESTREVARARLEGRPLATTVRAVLLRGCLLLAGVLAILAAASPLLVDLLGGMQAVVILGLAAVTLASSAFVRGPLAGDRRYGSFSTTLLVEAVACVAGALTLLAAGVGDPTAWMILLAGAPALGAAVAVLVGIGVRGVRATLAPRTTPVVPIGGTAASLLSAAGMFLFSQGVWNLAPVAVGARPTPPTVAAAFAATAVLLRAPVLVFPALQALLLPRLVGHTGGGPSRRVMTGAVVVAVVVAAVWVAGAVFLAPPVVTLLFGLDAAVGSGTVALLALSVAVGSGAQILQTSLVTDSARTPAVAIVWLAALAVLGGVCLLPGPGPVVGAWAQLAATLTALLGLAALLRRGPA